MRQIDKLPSVSELLSVSLFGTVLSTLGVIVTFSGVIYTVYSVFLGISSSPRTGPAPGSAGSNYIGTVIVILVGVSILHIGAMLLWIKRE